MTVLQNPSTFWRHFKIYNGIERHYPKLLHTGSHENASYEVSCKIIPDSEMLEDFKWNQSTSASTFASKERKIFHPSS
jgi:hypothetical protein